MEGKRYGATGCFGMRTVCENHTTLSIGAMREIVCAGAALVNVASGLIKAAKRLQKLHLVSAQYARDFIFPTQHM